MAVLQLIAGSTNAKIVSFAMGPLGMLSRVLSPLVGGEFTYASVEPDRESAPGQLAVVDLRKIYDLIKGGK
jgi:3-dehydroquinate dehydratase type I